MTQKKLLKEMKNIKFENNNFENSKNILLLHYKYSKKLKDEIEKNKKFDLIIWGQGNSF